MTDFLQRLRVINSSRLEAWEDGEKADGMFHAAELGGEVGEVLNEAKKLHREQMGWRGSRSTKEKLASEIGDTMICLDKLAAFYGIDIEEATTAKFDATSEKQGFPHKLGEPMRCDHCGRLQGSGSAVCYPPFEVQPHSFTGKR